MTIQSLEEYLRLKIDLLRDCNIIRDTRGHSRIPCFVLEKPAKLQSPIVDAAVKRSQPPRNATKFFMKIYQTDRVQDLQNIASTYHKAKVPTAQTIKLGYLSEIDQTYCIYEYIEGKTLRELLKQNSADCLERIGYRTGTELGNFRKVPVPENDFLSDFHRKLLQLLHNAHLQKRNYNKTHTVKLPRVNLQRLERSLWHLKTVIDRTELNFTHGDINLYNIIFHAQTPYFIDTDGSGVSLRGLDFRGNCWWGWTGNNTEREQAVYRGIYRGYFADQIPDSFHQELGFAIIYEFLLRLERYANVDEQTYYSFLRWHDILERTKYFENYQFYWF